MSGVAKLLGKGKFVEMEKDNAVLKEQLIDMMRKMKAMEQEYHSQLGKASENRANLEINIKKLESKIAHLHQEIEDKDKRIADLNRLAYPHRYRLSSGAELIHINVPNYLHPSLHIWTKVGEVLFDNVKFGISYDTAQQHFRGELTDEEFVNTVFEPQEQINAKQAQLLGAAFMLTSGGLAQTHVGTGGDGSLSDMPWGMNKRKR